MATLVENAIRIKQTFDDIHDAIVEQGVTPSGGVDTYANAISEIPLTIPASLAVFNYAALGNITSSGVSTNLLYIKSGSTTATAYFTAPSYGEWTCKRTGFYLICYGYGIHTNTTSGSAVTMKLYVNNSVVSSSEFAGDKGPHVAIANIPIQVNQKLKCSYQGKKNASGYYVSYIFRAYYIGRLEQ